MNKILVLDSWNMQKIIANDWNENIELSCSGPRKMEESKLPYFKEAKRSL